MALTEVVKGTGELGGDFAFEASLNQVPLASGQAGGAEQLVPVVSSLPISSLVPDSPNALRIQRTDGPGRLYYAASLDASRPVEDAPLLEQGMRVERFFYPAEDSCPAEDCAPLQSIQRGEQAKVRLVVTLPNDAYYFLLEDFIPAGAEILDTRLKTSQQGGELEPQAGQVDFDPERPFEKGWGWWYFNTAEIYDDHITWSADHLPAGTYELTYTLVTLQPGEYRVLPAHAWQFYFPEVQGNSAGDIFTITP
jgi:uncharacterized protein YfaS (alpha-2-macroglobulin family)